MYLLKAVSICLGIALLCGMSSFRTPEDMKIQQGYQTAAISNDTIITPDGEFSRCIKEIVVEGNQPDGICFLKVCCDYDANGQWKLCATNTYGRCVNVKYWYKIYINDTTVLEKSGSAQLMSNVDNDQINSGSLVNGVFELDSIDACFCGPEPNNQNRHSERK